MDQQRVKEIIEQIKQSKIAVYGDFCLDAYWIMDMRGSEVSVETGKKAEAGSAWKPQGARKQKCSETHQRGFVWRFRTGQSGRSGRGPSEQRSGHGGV